MKININNCNYSYTNAIGSAFKQPLFKLISNVAIAYSGKPDENQVGRIARIAYRCLFAVVFAVPASLAWLLGKSISYFSKTRIDREGLFLAPPPIQIPKEEEADEFIDIRVLSERFNQLNVKDNRSAGQTSKKDCLLRLCNWTATQHADIYPDEPSKRVLFCSQLSIFLKGLLKKIDSGEVSKEKETDLLIELAEASTRCYPTWLEVGAKLFAEVYGQTETVSVKLLRFIQEYKESIILEFCDKEVDLQWHSINFVRNILGHELGLNIALNEYDPYAVQTDRAFGKVLTRWLFLQRYENVNRLISSVQSRINAQKYDPSFHDCLVSAIKEQGIEKPEDYVAEHFYSEDHILLNEAGVNLLLRSIGVLK